MKNANENHETLNLKDKLRGSVWLYVRDDLVIGAMGSEPERFVGLSVARARHLARYGGLGSKAPV